MVSSFPYLAGSIIQGEFIYHVSVISERFEQINTLFEKINQEARHRHAPLTVFDIESEGKKERLSAEGKVAFGHEQKLAGEMKSQAEQQKTDEDETDSSQDENEDDFDYDNAQIVENTGWVWQRKGFDGWTVLIKNKHKV